VWKNVRKKRGRNSVIEGKEERKNNKKQFVA